MSTVLAAASTSSTVPWTEIVTASAGLLGVLAGAVVSARLTLTSERRKKHHEAEVAAVVEFLMSASEFQLSITRAVDQGRGSRDPSGKWTGPLVDTKRWNEALYVVAVVCEPSVVEAALKLDGALWILHTAAGELGPLVSRDWWTYVDPVNDARLDFVNAARTSMDGKEPLRSLTGRPDRNATVWNPGHWAEIRAHLEAEAPQ